MGFFELGTAEKMLEKAKRELARLEDDVSIDPVFNFFVTAYHIADYLDERLEEKVKKESWFRLCRDAGNKAKHMELTHSPDPEATKDYYLADGLGVQGVRWGIQWPDGEFREVVSFAREVIAKWEEFFVKHGIGQPPPPLTRRHLLQLQTPALSYSQLSKVEGVPRARSSVSLRKIVVPVHRNRAAISAVVSPSRCAATMRANSFSSHTRRRCVPM